MTALVTSDTPAIMQIVATHIPDVTLVTPERHEDARGWLSEVWNPAAPSAAGLNVNFVQDNQSHNPRAGTVRALHFQLPPFDQGKLVMCLSGAIYDVAVDLRVGSPSFGQHVGVEMRADEPRQMWIPSGFAHGYCSLEPDTRVFYKLTAPYHSEAARGVLWNDPDLGIDWPETAEAALVNDRDSSWPKFADLDSPFRWQG